MKRLLAAQCRGKGCPHLVWEYYLTTGSPQKRRRRGICTLLGKQPGYMDFCPLDTVLESVRGDEIRE